MSLKVVSTKNAPAAIGEPQTPGPYSQAIIANGFVYTAGQIAFDPDTMKIVGKGVVEQTTQTLKNLRAILEAAGTSLQKVYDMNDFVSAGE
ncbi:hypothetical protein HDU82_008547 [Entophlyctis luteolus]|nr:hypothetical protein HDU82_008547 [Entophlyctis luteolus]